MFDWFALVQYLFMAGLSLYVVAVYRKEIRQVIIAVPFAILFLSLSVYQVLKMTTTAAGG